MPRYLVEVSQPQAIAARRIADAVRALGSHFATHADWRQKDGMSTGTMIVEAVDRRGALCVVPPGLRTHVTVFPLEPAANAIAPSTRYAAAA